MALVWQCGRFTLDLREPKIMGVLNCTPDSFSDGGKFIEPGAAIARAHELVAQGADIIDVGAESTRPGSLAISSEEEIARLMPIVSALVKELNVPISIDTKKTATMRAMLELGADIINDVNGLQDDGAIEAVRDSDCGVCLMHMRGMPENMQQQTEYQNVVSEVNDFLQSRTQICLQHGIAQERIALDPGFGFGKTPEQNMDLVRNINIFAQQRYPVLLGVSRKSTVGYLLGNVPVEARLTGSVVLAVLGALSGANILRVHDVPETRDALKIVSAFQKQNK